MIKQIYSHFFPDQVDVGAVNEVRRVVATVLPSNKVNVEPDLKLEKANERLELIEELRLLKECICFLFFCLLLL